MGNKSDIYLLTLLTTSLIPNPLIFIYEYIMDQNCEHWKRFILNTNPNSSNSDDYFHGPESFLRTWKSLIWSRYSSPMKPETSLQSTRERKTVHSSFSWRSSGMTSSGTLDYYTFPSPYYLLLKSCIIGRHFQIRYNNSYSNWQQLKSGIPQGSVMALLYLTTRKRDGSTIFNV
jgi:hypothetical protein